MEKILVSACLLGQRVRYHVGDAKVEDDHLSFWAREGRLIAFCPEVAAGMAVPRAPSERVGDRILNENGTDVTEIYSRGAEMALALAKLHGIRIAILKDVSPSCGSLQIYDGTFSGQKIPGAGVTATILKVNGIAVFSESEIEGAYQKLLSIEQPS